jgi:predicted histidine transporter YuiF (NhaC family)
MLLKTYSAVIHLNDYLINNCLPHSSISFKKAGTIFTLFIGLFFTLGIDSAFGRCSLNTG